MINFEADTPLPSVDMLKGISELAEMQLIREVEVERATLRLKEARQALFKIQEIELPDLMLQAGMEKFTLSNGKTVEVKETLYASIAKKNKAAALKWLETNGHGSLISENLSVPFEKGMHAQLTELIDLLEHNGYPAFSVGETVNTGSIKALIKELLADGIDVPLDLFGAHFARASKITG